MMHFFRRSKIHLDCFTSRKGVIETAPVVNGMEAIPEWWRKLPKHSYSQFRFYPEPTMKTCSGVIDYYNNSVAMPLWTELAIKSSNGDFSWQFADKLTEAISHAHSQYEGFLNNSLYSHLKIISPWLFDTKSDVNWLLTDPVYNHVGFSGYVLAQGVVNFHRQPVTNLQFFIDKGIPDTFIVPFGSVFLFTPMSDKKVVVHRHLITEAEFKRRESVTAPITFINKYKNQQKILKCPYKDNTK